MESELLSFDDAVKFCEEAAAENCQILGVERFFRIEGRILPDLNAIADFSSLGTGDVVQSLQSARAFFSHFGNDDKEVFAIVYQNS
jgi:hypothetical protein